MAANKGQKDREDKDVEGARKECSEWRERHKKRKNLGIVSMT
jgi:hypothetical protein